MEIDPLCALLPESRPGLSTLRFLNVIVNVINFPQVKWSSPPQVQPTAFVPWDGAPDTSSQLMLASRMT